ncbi:Kinesin-7 [Hexamita inflata]|uniref:Kinesin-7 n=1 Tax=Hexamita inflata TaxID=28002 RepID=A0AA86NTG0_9EUKA|nr:Kinesin-7 [Hexamita inflata]
MSVLMRRENTLIIEPGSDISKIQIINFILLPNSKKHFEGPPLQQDKQSFGMQMSDNMFYSNNMQTTQKLMKSNGIQPMIFNEPKRMQTEQYKGLDKNMQMSVAQSQSIQCEPILLKSNNMQVSTFEINKEFQYQPQTSQLNDIGIQQSRINQSGQFQTDPTQMINQSIQHQVFNKDMQFQTETQSMNLQTQPSCMEQNISAQHQINQSVNIQTSIYQKEQENQYQIDMQSVSLQVAPNNNDQQTSIITQNINDMQQQTSTYQFDIQTQNDTNAITECNMQQTSPYQFEQNTSIIPIEAVSVNIQITQETCDKSIMQQQEYQDKQTEVDEYLSTNTNVQTDILFDGSQILNQENIRNGQNVILQEIAQLLLQPNIFKLQMVENLTQQLNSILQQGISAEQQDKVFKQQEELINQNNNQLANFKQQMEQKDQELEEMKIKLQEKDQQLKLQTDQILMKDSELKQLDANNIELLQQIETLQKTNLQQQDELHAYEQQLQTEFQNNNELQQLKNVQKQNYDQQLNNLQDQTQTLSLKLENTTSLLEQAKEQLQEIEDKNQLLAKSMQTSFNEQEIKEVTEKLLEIKAVDQQLEQQNEYKEKYELLEQKFNKLLQQSKTTIGQVMKTAKEREENLLRKAADEIKSLVKYKEMVLKMQKQQQQAQLQKIVPKSE